MVERWLIYGLYMVDIWFPNHPIAGPQAVWAFTSIDGFRAGLRLKPVEGKGPMGPMGDGFHPQNIDGLYMFIMEKYGTYIAELLYIYIYIYIFTWM